MTTDLGRLRRAALRQLLRARTCYVCRQPIAEADGCYYPRLGILVHQDACSAAVTTAGRVYDRSAQGRQRTAAEWLRHVPRGEPIVAAIRSRVAQIRSARHRPDVLRAPWFEAGL